MLDELNYPEKLSTARGSVLSKYKPIYLQISDYYRVTKGRMSLYLNVTYNCMPLILNMITFNTLKRLNKGKESPAGRLANYMLSLNFIS